MPETCVGVLAYASHPRSTEGNSSWVLKTRGEAHIVTVVKEMRHGVPLTMDAVIHNGTRYPLRDVRNSGLGKEGVVSLVVESEDGDWLELFTDIPYPGIANVKKRIAKILGRKVHPAEYPEI